MIDLCGGGEEFGSYISLGTCLLGLLSEAPGLRHDLSCLRSKESRIQETLEGSGA